MSTYTATHRKSYLKNKERIRERTREYKKKYGHEYYLLHKEEIAKKDKQKRINLAKKAILDQNLSEP